MGLEEHVEPNGIYSFEDAAVLYIPAVYDRPDSQSVFLVFDKTELPRVQFERERGNKLTQLENGRSWWTIPTAQSTTNGGAGCNSRLFHRWLMVTDSTEER